MKTRRITALAASGLVAAVVVPSTAHAATGSGVGPHQVVTKASPLAALKSQSAFQKNTVKSRASVAVNGLTASLAATIEGAETFDFDATQSADTASTITSYSIDFGDGTAVQTNTAGTFTHKYGWAGSYTATVTVTDGAGTTATATVSAVTPGSDYTPYGPYRILDTRSGTGAAEHTVAANGTLKLKIAGAGVAGKLIPAGVTAVAMNVTVTNPTQPGFITAYPDGAPAPTASNVNFAKGETIPNLVVVQVGPDGTVDLKNSSKGSVNLVADVVGYYSQTKASQYVSIKPSRLLDTRHGTGTGGVVKQVPANGSITVKVAGVGAIPKSGVTAIAANITVTKPQTIGFVTAYPSGENLPNASNVNYAGGQTVPNMSTTPVGGNGDIVVHNSSKGAVDVIIDVSGYFSNLGGAGIGTTTNSYVPESPWRDLDTRKWGGGPLQADTYYFGLWGYPPSDGITGIVFNATATDPQTIGYITLYPVNDESASEIPNVSNVNYAHNQTVANLAFVPLGTNALDEGDGVPRNYMGAANASNGTTDLVLDEEGLFFDN